jgi:hypothetical protein
VALPFATLSQVLPLSVETMKLTPVPFRAYFCFRYFPETDDHLMELIN